MPQWTFWQPLSVSKSQTKFVNDSWPTKASLPIIYVGLINGRMIGLNMKFIKLIVVHAQAFASFCLCSPTDLFKAFQLGTVPRGSMCLSAG